MNHLFNTTLYFLLLLVGIYAAAPQLSPSFSFSGTALEVVNGGNVTFTRYDIAIDVPRCLLADLQEYTIDGSDFTIHGIISVTDVMVYLAQDGMCATSAFVVNPSKLFDYQNNLSLLVQYRW